MDSALAGVLINAGVAGIIVLLLVLGILVPKWAYQKLLEENEKLKEALALERQRSNDASAAGAVTNQLIGALTTLASERKGAEHLEAPPAPGRRPLELTGEDLGL